MSINRWQVPLLNIDPRKPSETQPWAVWNNGGRPPQLCRLFLSNYSVRNSPERGVKHFRHWWLPVLKKKRKESAAFLFFSICNSERSQMAKATGREWSGEVHTCLERLQIMKGSARQSTYAQECWFYYCEPGIHQKAPTLRLSPTKHPSPHIGVKSIWSYCF